jgi:hypothetical protein
MSDEQARGCAKCRFHSKQERRKALEVGDGELELVSFDDKPEVFLMCKHPSLGEHPKEMGTEASAPGADCEKFEAGKKGLSPELQRLLDRKGL